MNLKDGIEQAIEQVWSGRLEVDSDSRQEGQIVFCHGRIAWATCAGQSESLGTFLWRLGRISREQLLLARTEYAKHGGKKRLGAILEEARLMSRPVLRRCLMLHTRCALNDLSDIAQTGPVRVTPREGDFAGDEAILFAPEDVLPPSWAEELCQHTYGGEDVWERGWGQETPNNALLGELVSLQGYRAAAVIGRDGNVLAAHRVGRLDLQRLSVSVATLMEVAYRTVRPATVGGVGVVTLTCDDGGLTARWIDERRHFLVFVLTEHHANAALVQHSLRKVLPDLQKYVATEATTFRSSDYHELSTMVS